ncbi:PhoX family phosphatase [Leptospira sp. WS58.C1]|uniref:PhoX family protein n=1 Tax=Leptospira cinconiae TaxID=3235173 RepID=UPI00349E8AC8
MKVSRSDFLKYMGKGMLALTAVRTLDLFSETAKDPSKKVPSTHSSSQKTKKGNFSKIPGNNFKPIKPNTQDDLILAAGFKYDLIAVYGDKINSKGDTFGYAADFNCFFQFPNDPNSALLWTNHEYLNELEYYVTGYDYNQTGPNNRTSEQIEKYLYSLGGSVIGLRKLNGTWVLDPDSKYGRRLHGRSEFQLKGPVAGSEAIAGKSKVYGTFANCSGGRTLWDTVLSCEENYEMVVEDCKLEDSKEYGWIIEVDPFDPFSTPVKHTALGRFSHENAALTVSPSGKLVVYMGDDSKDQCVYKFVSEKKYDPKKGKLNSELLDEGTLYVGNFEKCVWVPLDLEKNPNLKNAKDKEGKLKFKTQADVLISCRDAAKTAGGTPMDRPEDLEVHPLDKSVFVSFTNNDSHGNFYGQIVRIKEENSDAESVRFEFEVFVAGGGKSGFSSPDNLVFDSSGNLWMVTDMTTRLLGKSIFKKFGNNGLFFIPTSGEDAGKAFQFASAPIGAEFTGPWFTPDEEYLFLSVQHPGEDTKDYDLPTSRWPRRTKGDIPRPGVVVIRRA